MRAAHAGERQYLHECESKPSASFALKPLTDIFGGHPINYNHHIESHSNVV